MSSKKTREGSRSLLWSGNIDRENFNLFTEDIDRMCSEDPGKPIDLRICSPGGSSEYGFAFYDTVRFIYKANLTTICIGRVASIAILVFLAGVKRIIAPNASICFHEFARMFDQNTQYNATELSGIGRSTMATQERFIRIVAENSDGKADAKTVKKWLIENRTLFAEDAVRFGIAHTILGQS